MLGCLDACLALSCCSSGRHVNANRRGGGREQGKCISPFAGGRGTGFQTAPVPNDRDGGRGW